MSAALDSVKEHTTLPWTSRHAINAPSTTPVSETQVSPAEAAEMTPIIATQGPAPQIHEVAKVTEPITEVAPEGKAIENEMAAPKPPEIPRVLRFNNFLQALERNHPLLLRRLSAVSLICGNGMKNLVRDEGTAKSARYGAKADLDLSTATKLYLRRGESQRASLTLSHNIYIISVISSSHSASIAL